MSDWEWTPTDMTNVPSLAQTTGLGLALTGELVVYAVNEDGRTVGGPALARMSHDGRTLDVTLVEPITVREAGNISLVFYNDKGERWLEAAPVWTTAGGSVVVR